MRFRSTGFPARPLADKNVRVTAIRRVASNTFILLGVNLSGAVLGFLIAVISGRGLGADGLGRYSLVLAWTFGLGMFAEFGLNTLITREVARDKDRASEFLFTSLVAKTVLAFFLVAALVIAAPSIAHESELIAALQLGSILIWFNALYGSFTAIFRAFERMTPILILNIGGLALQLTGTLLLIANGQNIVPLIALGIIIQATQAFAAFVFYRVTFASLAPFRVSIASLAMMLRAALPFAFASVISAIEARANFVLLGSLQTDNAVGIYSAASRFTDAAKFLPNAFFGAAFPAFAAMAAGSENYFRRARFSLFLFAGAAALALTAFAQPILTISFGSAFTQAQPALIILSWSLVPALVNGLTLLFLYARGEESRANKLLTLSLVVQLIAAMPLIQTFGASGAAFSALIGDLALFALLNAKLRLTFYALRKFLIPVSIFSAAILIRLILIQQTQFDGLYGQDPYAYLDYSVALKSSIAQGQVPPPFFWPIGYPTLVALASLFVPITIAAQAVSVIASALIATLTFLLTQDILRDQPRADLAAIVAALIVVGAGQMLVSSLSAMSDAAALFWVMLSAFALVRFYSSDLGRRDKNVRWLALAAFALGCAITTRWVYALLVPVWIIAIVSLRATPALQRTRCGASERSNLLISVISLLIALLPQLVLMLYHSSRGIISNAGDLQTVSWNLTNAWQSTITNGDGRFVYPVPIAAFYAQASAHPSFIFPLLTPFILIGAWTLRCKKFFLSLLGGWIIGIWIFLAGIAWENPRFSLAFFPPLAILVGVGLQKFLLSYPRLEKFAVTFAFICIALTFGWGYRAVENFAAAQRADRAVAEWASEQLPADATVIAFSITETLKHRTPFRVVEIYNESPETLEKILERSQPLFVLLDLANIESQWKNLSPEKNLRALQSKANLSIIATRKPYTLFAVTR